MTSLKPSFWSVTLSLANTDLNINNRCMLWETKTTDWMSAYSWHKDQTWTVKWVVIPTHDSRHVFWMSFVLYTFSANMLFKMTLIYLWAYLSKSSCHGVSSVAFLPSSTNRLCMCSVTSGGRRHTKIHLHRNNIILADRHLDMGMHISMYFLHPIRQVGEWSYNVLLRSNIYKVTDISTNHIHI